MATIIGINLGKFKSVAWTYDSLTTAAGGGGRPPVPRVERVPRRSVAPSFTRNPVRNPHPCHGPSKVRS